MIVYQAVPELRALMREVSTLLKTTAIYSVMAMLTLPFHHHHHHHEQVQLSITFVINIPIEKSPEVQGHQAIKHAKPRCSPGVDDQGNFVPFDDDHAMTMVMANGENNQNNNNNTDGNNPNPSSSLTTRRKPSSLGISVDIFFIIIMERRRSFCSLNT
jgi:hypothetical protein